MGHVIIGKYALESLTSGMYTDPLVIFREYIQNAVDSIDIAYKENILDIGQEKVLIELFPLEGRIEIYDNGIGIKSSIAEATLTGIGNSQKDHYEARGFRGIGRLAALGYCNKLSFETSFQGESVKTRIVIDSSGLTKILLTNNKGIEVPADRVMDMVCSCEQHSEPRESHFFRVILEGIDQSSDLLNTEYVKEYIEQVAPIPFNSLNFIWGKEIYNRVKQCGYSIPSYRIQIRYGTELIDIYKPYQDSFIIDKSKNETDSIQDITVQQIVNSNNELAAIIWLAHSGYKCSISDRKVKGLRLRKGNILIGGWQTLNSIFKDARFNGWTIGEVHVLDPNLLPNARRDNFEKNQSYFSFTEKMTSLSSDIVKQIKNSTLKRNPELLTAIEKANNTSDNVKNVLQESYISPNKKGVVVQKISDAKKTLAEVESVTSIEEAIQEIAFNELDLLMGKIQGATSYKAVNLLENLNKTEKKVLERVISILTDHLPKNESEKAIDTIINAFSK